MCIWPDIVRSESRQYDTVKNMKGGAVPIVGREDALVVAGKRVLNFHYGITADELMRSARVLGINPYSKPGVRKRCGDIFNEIRPIVENAVVHVREELNEVVEDKPTVDAQERYQEFVWAMCVRTRAGDRKRLKQLRNG